LVRSLLFSCSAAANASRWATDLQELTVNQKLKERLARACRLTYDLVAHLEEASLNLDLPNLPSNRIASQLWCIRRRS
jgi:predicted class III extradiol MEMO1 family dioxygenase